ncbi:MAG: TlpA family protein disulfide reductase [Arenibacterium sp.]
MRLVHVLTLYMALAFGANAVAADIAVLESLRDGTMKKLNFHDTPKPVSEAEFILPNDEGTATLATYRGQYVVLNFWATWCAPCRHEMPTLSALQAEFGGDDFSVVTLATGRNSPTGIVKFFDEIGADNLTRYQDPKQKVARDMSVLGLPITVIIDPEGQEIARLIGDADWYSDSAREIIGALLEKKPDS